VHLDLQTVLRGPSEISATAADMIIGAPRTIPLGSALLGWITFNTVRFGRLLITEAMVAGTCGILTPVLGIVALLQIWRTHAALTEKNLNAPVCGDRLLGPSLDSTSRVASLDDAYPLN